MIRIIDLGQGVNEEQTIISSPAGQPADFGAVESPALKDPGDAHITRMCFHCSIHAYSTYVFSLFQQFHP